MIYFVQAAGSGLIKIGYTDSSMARRLETLQVGNASRLEVLGTMPGDKKAERALHKKFHHAKYRGEWFRPLDDLVNFIVMNANRFSDEFAKLVEIEPALLALWKEAASWHKNTDPNFCANAVWYGYGEWRHRGIKEELCRLVGWEAWKKELKTTEAYDIAYDTIYEALPDCRQCICLALMGAL